VFLFLEFLIHKTAQQLEHHKNVIILTNVCYNFIFIFKHQMKDNFLLQNFDVLIHVFIFKFLTEISLVQKKIKKFDGLPASTLDSILKTT
jgi:hypothetical protein